MNDAISDLKKIKKARLIVFMKFVRVHAGQKDVGETYCAREEGPLNKEKATWMIISNYRNETTGTTEKNSPKSDFEKCND